MNRAKTSTKAPSNVDGTYVKIRKNKEKTLAANLYLRTKLYFYISTKLFLLLTIHYFEDIHFDCK